MSNITEFNKTITGLLTRLERKSRNPLEIANLERLRKRISLLKSTMGDEELIRRAAPVLLQYSEQIMNNDKKFFTELDVISECKKHDVALDETDNYIFDMIESIKRHYNAAGTEEQDKVFTEVNQLLFCAAKFVGG